MNIMKNEYLYRIWPVKRMHVHLPEQLFQHFLYVMQYWVVLFQLTFVKSVDAIVDISFLASL